MRGGADGCYGEARGCVGMAGGSAARVARLLSITIHRTPQRCLDDPALLAVSGPKNGFSAWVLGCRSRTGAKIGWRTRLIGKKIIGRATRVVAPRVSTGDSLVIRRWPFMRLTSRGGMLALLHQPARQHSRCVLFKPGIQQLRDLLAEIGRVAQTGEFVALQGSARRREKELPRRLGLVIQGDLQGKRRHITTVITKVNSTHVRNECGKLWKSFARDRELLGCAAAGLGKL
jgi:hypothetical protein